MSNITEEEKKAYKKAFDDLDVDNNGWISGNELKKMMQIDTHMSEADVDAFFKQADIDHNGQVSFDGEYRNSD